MSRSVLLLAVIVAGAHTACGIDTTASGVFAPCTRSSDCESGLSCPSGFCTPPDAAVADATGSQHVDAGDASPRDTGARD